MTQSNSDELKRTDQSAIFPVFDLPAEALFGYKPSTEATFSLNGLVCGRGAPTYPLSVGFIMGLVLAGVPLNSIGGPSGGSLVPLLYKCGMPLDRLAVLTSRIKSRELLTSNLAYRDRPWQARLILLTKEIWRRADARMQPAPAKSGADTPSWLDVSVASVAGFLTVSVAGLSIAASHTVRFVAIVAYLVAFGSAVILLRCQAASWWERISPLAEETWRRVYARIPHPGKASGDKKFSLLTILFGNETLAVLTAEIMRRVYEKTLPDNALFGSAKYGTFLAGHVNELLGSKKKLPDGYWTICITTGDNGVRQKAVFTSQGVYLERIRKSETDEVEYDKIATELPEVEKFLRGTIAIPGIIEPIIVMIEGRIYVFFDGVVSLDERHCPVSPIVKVLGQSKESVIIFDVGEDKRSFFYPINSLKGWLQDKAYLIACRSCYVGKTELKNGAAGIVIRPRYCNDLSYLSLKVGELPKLFGILEGCRATLEGLMQAGWCHPKHLERVDVIIKQAKKIRRRKQLKRLFLCGGKGEATAEVKRLMASHGMFDLNV